MSRDPAGEAGGINVYAIAGNAVTHACDPFGLWGTDAHHTLVDLWLQKKPAPEGKTWDKYQWHCITIDVPVWLKYGSDHVDGVGLGLGAFCDAQSSRNSYQHAMRAWYETANHAQAKYNAFISMNFAEAMVLRAQAQATSSDDEKKYMMEDAVERIGRAGHAVEDSTSPPHAGFQLWFGIPDGIAILGPIGYAAFCEAHHFRERSTVFDGMKDSAATTVADKMHPYLEDVLRE